MTQDDIIRMAKEACVHHVNFDAIYVEGLEEFAALVAEAEREACAELCLKTEPFYGQMFAEAIRARGKK